MQKVIMKNNNIIFVIIGIVVILFLIYFFTFQPTCDNCSTTQKEPLYFATMIHLEGDWKIENEKDFIVRTNRLKELVDLFDKYDAKVTMESELPYVQASLKWGNGKDAMNYALEKEHGTGSHCDFGTHTRDFEKELQDFTIRKKAVDDLVSSENNWGCSGGFGPTNWIQAASDANFKYLNSTVMFSYLSAPLQNRPINPKTSKPFTDEEIYSTYYHDPALPMEERIYPRMLKDSSDLEEDNDGVILLMPGTLGEFNSLYEGRKNCFPSCEVTKEDGDYIIEQINYANSFRSDKFALMYIHFPDYTIALPPNKKQQQYEIVENWLKEMKVLQDQGKIKWVTMKEAYELYSN
jgi:hypothetical protein